MTGSRAHVPSDETAMSFICESPWGFAELDPDGRFTWLNLAYCRLLNAPFELVVGTDIRTWIHPDDTDIFDLKMEQLVVGQIPGFLLSKKYIQRGSTPQRRLVIWGILSVQGKWEPTTGSYLGSRITFRQYDPIPEPARLDLSNLRSYLVQGVRWSIHNWRTVVTVIAVAMSLMVGSSGKLSETLQRAKDTKDSVDSALDSLSSGVLSLPASPSQPTPP